MRGKYAAKAANRTANLDNDLLQAAIAERDEARAERDMVSLELQEAQRNQSSRALAAANVIAAEQVAIANKRVQDQAAEHARFKNEAADWLLEFVGVIQETLKPGPEVAWMPRDLFDFYETLDRRAGEMSAVAIGNFKGSDHVVNRTTKRLGTRKQKAMTLAEKQRRNMGPIER
jgi:hypothetical protein